MPLDTIVLYSGGLDSILAARTLMSQGLRVRCLHFISPFFGSESMALRHARLYGLDMDCLDVSLDFALLLAGTPQHGYGKVMNPCVDCKILLLKHAKAYMEARGARFLATGEVIGQRPMSQRRDTMFLIPREAGVREILLRPLCARHLPPTPMEENGLVDREKLFAFSGRGRQEQLSLASFFELPEIPAPGGGCRLTERENARRYWPVLQFYRHAPCGQLARNFHFANLGRQFWRREFHLCVGRNNEDNRLLSEYAGANDAVLKLSGYPGPVAVATGGRGWPREILEEAAAHMAAYSPKAVASGDKIVVRVRGEDSALEVFPKKHDWCLPAWEEVRGAVRNENMLCGSSHIKKHADMEKSGYGFHESA